AEDAGNRARRDGRSVRRAVLPRPFGRDRRTRRSGLSRRRRPRRRAVARRGGSRGAVRRPRPPALREGARRDALRLSVDSVRPAHRARARRGARYRPRRVRVRRSRPQGRLDGLDPVGMGWDDKPVVITVAPTGAEVTREDNPALPHTPVELAEDAAACADAGAAVVHLHVREEDGTPSARPELFAQTISLIRERSELVTMVSTGGAVWMPMDERMAGLDAEPDMAGVETGSMNFGEEPFV